LPRGLDEQVALRSRNERADIQTSSAGVIRTATKRGLATRARPASKKRATPSASKKGEETAERAKRAGATGRRITMGQRRLRDSAIIARAAAGWTHKMIAEEFELTDRQVRRILNERGSLPSGLDERPLDLIEDLARGLRASIADFEAMAYDNSDRNPNAALGAKKAAAEARWNLAVLLRSLGKLPDDLSSFRSEAEIAQVAQAMVDKLQDVVRKEATPADALEFFCGLVLPKDQIQHDRASRRSTTA